MGKEKGKTLIDEIIFATRKLFTDKGYDNVSLRDIANELNISVGNLNYYYPKKEDLLEAVVIDKHNGYVKPSSAKSLHELNSMLMITKKFLEKHLYYFRHYSQFSQISKKIADMQRQVSKDSYEVWFKSFSNLCEEGLLEEERYEGQFYLLITSIIFLLIHWHERDFTDQRLHTKTPDLMECLWSIIFPLLTEKGKVIYLTEIDTIKKED